MEKDKMQQLPQTTLGIFNVEANILTEEKLPPKGFVIHTAYEPDPTSSRISGELGYADFIEGQAKKEDRAVIIVCAPIGKSTAENFRHFASTRSNVEQAGLGNYAEIRHRANAIHTSSQRGFDEARRTSNHLGI